VVHAIQHLPHRVYFRFATFEFLEREADGKMLCELHQHCLIQLFVLALFGKPGQRVSQSVLRTRRASASPGPETPTRLPLGSE